MVLLACKQGQVTFKSQILWFGALSMKGFLSETEDDKTSPLQNEGMDFEEWELPVKLKKYRETSESHHVTCTMHEAVRESVPPHVREFVSAHVVHGWKPLHSGVNSGEPFLFRKDGNMDFERLVAEM